MLNVKITLLVVGFFCSSVFGGLVTVKFAETDFSNHENEPSLESTLVITGTQEDGDLVFSVQALTVQQYQEMIGQPESTLCNNDLVLPDIDEAEGVDLTSVLVECTRTLGNTNTELPCQFPIAVDGILEGNEYFVLVLTVVDNAGNDITLDRNCAVGRILTQQSEANQFSLQVLNESLVLTEGDPAVYIDIVKEFETELPVLVSFSHQLRFPDSGTLLLTSLSDSDFELNDGTNSIIIPPDVTRAQVKFTAVEDILSETSEFLSVQFSASINVPDLIEIAVNPQLTDIEIQDNNQIRAGFDPSTVPAEISMVETNDTDIRACATLIEPQDSLRDFEVDIDPIDGTALQGTDFEVVGYEPEFRDDRILTFNPEVCVTVRLIDNEILDGTKTFTIELSDRRLKLLDPSQVDRWMELNMLEPRVVTVTILDNEAVPLSPVVETPAVSADGEISFKWTTDEENGLREVDCHFGTITELMEDENSGEDQTTYIRGEEITFDYCSGSEGDQLEHAQSGFDRTGTYEVVVCARNQVSTACSDPVIYRPPPPPAVTGLSTGAIAGIIVAILLLFLCCLLLLLLLCLLWCCGCERERRYFPAKREKEFAAVRHSAHFSGVGDEFDEVKIPLD